MCLALFSLWQAARCPYSGWELPEPCAPRLITTKPNPCQPVCNDTLQTTVSGATCARSGHPRWGAHMCCCYSVQCAGGRLMAVKAPDFPFPSLPARCTACAPRAVLHSLYVCVSAFLPATC